MKKNSFVIFGLILIILLGKTVEAQQNTQKPSNSSIADVAITRNPEGNSDWTKVDFDKFLLYLPKDFKVKKIEGPDFSFELYEYEQFEVMVLDSIVSGPSVKEQKLSSFNRKYLYINKIFTHIWWYKSEESSNTYIAEACFYLDNKIEGDTALVRVVSKEDNFETLAKEIFLSFNLKSK